MRLHAEPAAHVRDTHAHLIHRHFQDGFRQRLLQAGRVLAARMQCDAAACLVELRDAAARFHGHRDEPLVMERELGDVLRVRERRRTSFRLAPLHLRRNIAGRLLGQTCGAPFASAASIVVTAGSSWYSTATCSAASSACARVCATTAATAWPTKRTSSTASAWYGGAPRAFRRRPPGLGQAGTRRSRL